MLLTFGVTQSLGYYGELEAKDSHVDAWAGSLARGLQGRSGMASLAKHCTGPSGNVQLETPSKAAKGFSLHPQAPEPSFRRLFHN